MDDNRITGTAKSIAGQAQEAVGSLLGDRDTQIKGKARQVEGSAERAYGETLDTIRDLFADRPILTLASVAGAAFLLGAVATSARRAD